MTAATTYQSALVAQVQVTVVAEEDTEQLDPE
jgi:hypothetical protein